MLSADREFPRIKRILAPGIPYITVGIGLWVFQNAWIAFFGYHIGVIALVLLTEKKLSLKELLRSKDYRIPVAGAIIGASGGLLLYLLWPLLLIPVDLNAYLQGIGLTAITWPFFIAYHILVNPWVEEYYWRGYLGSDAKRVVLNDLLFSGYHMLVLAGKVEIVWLLVIFLALTSAAWFWRQIARLNQGLLASSISHMAGEIGRASCRERV